MVGGLKAACELQEVGAEQAVGAEDDDEADVVLEGEVGDGSADVVVEVVGVGLELGEGVVGGHGWRLEVEALMCERGKGGERA